MLHEEPVRGEVAGGVSQARPCAQKKALLFTQAFSLKTKPFGIKHAISKGLCG